MASRESFRLKASDAQSMYQQMFREKRDYERELSQTILSLRQEINNVRKQNRDLRIEKSAAIEYKSS